MTCGHFSFLVAEEEALWFLNITTAFGTASVLIFGTVSCGLYWGPTYMGINWGLLLLAPGLGGTGLTSLATFLISDNARGGCRMAKCFLSIFVISSGLGALATVLFGFLWFYHWRYWRGK